MNITIQTILHEQQAYDTPGNWRFDQNGNLLIEVSAMGDWRYELLVALHELIEVGICKHRGISQEAVDAFDIQYDEFDFFGRIVQFVFDLPKLGDNLVVAGRMERFGVTPGEWDLDVDILIFLEELTQLGNPRDHRVISYRHAQAFHFLLGLGSKILQLIAFPAPPDSLPLAHQFHLEISVVDVRKPEHVNLRDDIPEIPHHRDLIEPIPNPQLVRPRGKAFPGGIVVVDLSELTR